MTKNALIIVDIQNDFVGGTLATDPLLSFTQKTADWIAEHKDDYDHVVTTQDWHIEPGDHFENWPVHCRADTQGAEIHSLITDALMDTEYECFLKGQYSDGYSGFDGVWEKDGQTGLAPWLYEREVHSVTVIGIATEHCVRATAFDAVAEGLSTEVLRGYVNAVNDNVANDLLDNEFGLGGVKVR